MSGASDTPEHQDPEKPESIPPVSEESFNFPLGAELFNKRYVVIRCLGKGGMGEVYLVMDRMMEKEVALKLLLPRLVTEDRKAVSRFRREARITCDLHHPHIVTVYDIDQADHIYYLKMEYIEGCSLREWKTQQQKPIPLIPILTFGIQLCEALQYAHAKGIIHRDIKPGNIMITGDQQVKLLDFGIARLKTYKDVTTFGVLIGTIDYMAPERYSDPDTVDPRTDIYSLAAVLYELLVGRVPLGRIELPGRYRSDVPQALDAAIDKALSNDPEYRYPTAQEFGAVLQQIRDSLLINGVENSSDANNRIPKPEPVTPVTRKEKQDEPAKPEESTSHETVFIQHAMEQALALEKQGNIPAAIALLEVLLKGTLKPNQTMLVTEEINRLKKIHQKAEHWKQQAQQHESANQLDRAWQCWHEALELTPHDQVIREHINQLERKRQTIPPPPVKLQQSSRKPNRIVPIILVILCGVILGLSWMVWKKNPDDKVRASEREKPTPLAVKHTATPEKPQGIAQTGMSAPVKSVTSTATVTPNRTSTLTVTATTSPQSSPTNTITPFVIPTALAVMHTATPVKTQGMTQTGMSAPVKSVTLTATVTPTRTSTPTVTATISPQSIPTNMITPTLTPTRTQTRTPLPTATPAITKASAPTQIVVSSINYPMVKISAGSFRMGSPDNEPDRESDEMQHDVKITKPFYMGVTEVSQAQWKKIMGSCNAYFKGDDLPVEKVRWFEVVEFCNKISQREGLTLCYQISGTSVQWDKSANGYRLPTETEWEYACRAGTTSAFNTGNNLTTNQANYDGNYNYNNNPKGTYERKTVSVTNFDANTWGLKNMHGNVWEWCWDWYDNYPNSLVVDSTGPLSGSFRVLRGGGWSFDARFCRSAIRYGVTPASRLNNCGCRLARFVSLDP